jgi:hypothetical protein
MAGSSDRSKEILRRVAARLRLIRREPNVQNILGNWSRFITPQTRSPLAAANRIIGKRSCAPFDFVQSFPNREKRGEGADHQNLSLEQQ